MRENFTAIYNAKAEYVDMLDAAIVGPSSDFVKVEYARDALSAGEYVRLKDCIGGVSYINVTGNSHEAILKEVCRAVLRLEPIGSVRNKDAIREIARYFKN